MAGIDLHSNNLFCAIVDMNGKRVFEKKLPCDLESVLKALKPFKKRLEKRRCKFFSVKCFSMGAWP
jgi:hypothetical protein